VAAFLLLTTSASAESSPADDFMALADFAKRYAVAWSSQDPESLAALYSPDGSLTVNDGEPAVGREAIAEKARGFMEDFPDMKVEMVAVQQSGDGARFDWRWTGRNTGPGGTGRYVNITGFEMWTFGPDGLILESKGNYDQDEYQRQVNPPQ
jgi:uncharacterized protein (TIGR02246 family)